MKLQTYIGLAALLLFAIAVNVGVWQQAFFVLPVLGPLVLAAMCGGVWLALALTANTGSATLQGRAVGATNAVLSSIFFLGICVVLYAFAQYWGASWDLTQEGRRELSPQTIQVLQGMMQEVEVLCFFLSTDDELVLIARDKTRRFLEQCQEHTSMLDVEFLDPQIDRPRLEALNVTHASPQGTVILKAGTRQRVITLSGGSPRLEERQFTNALVNVLRESKPKVYFLSGHGERDIDNTDERNGGSMLKNLLTGEAYEVAKHGIKINDPEIPADCDLLVINNPTGDLHPLEIETIEAYLNQGGRMMLLLDVWKSVRQGLLGKEAMRPWIEDKYGIRIGQNVVINPAQENIWQIELSNDKTPFQNNNQGPQNYNGNFNANHSVTRGFDQVMLLLAARTVEKAGESGDNLVVNEILRSTPAFYAETDVAKLAEAGQATVSEDEAQGPLPLAATAVKNTGEMDPGGRPEQARILVVGDADFASNAQLSVPGNLNFVLNAIAWLTENEDLIAIRPTGKEDDPVILDETDKRTIAWVSILFTTQLVVVAGLVVFAVRRKYQ